MRINTDFLARCIHALERAQDGLQNFEHEDVLYDVFRAACVKEFEIILEQCGKLLKKRLRPFFASNRETDRLIFKDIFRHAAKHGLISVEACERWLVYRDARNDTTHEYGTQFAERTLKLLPSFIADATQVRKVLSEPTDD
ncbi:MAG: nucleotidyltransferase substrate binding protein [bacterium]|nr:nucleotidyltransferase substrate binding protein [bacterium]